MGVLRAHVAYWLCHRRPPAVPSDMRKNQKARGAQGTLEGSVATTPSDAAESRTEGE